MSAIGLQFKDLLIAVVTAPLEGGKLIYLTPGGGFSFIFTLCLYFGALFTIPVAVFQIFQFLQPLIAEASQRFIAGIMIISTLLAAAGASFGYFYAIPAAINFLSNIAGDAIIASLTADSYLGFVVSYMLGLAVLFQLPLLLFLVDHVKPLPPGWLMNSQRYLVVVATILAALITPTPDMLNMAIVAGPIVIVYQFGALAVFARRRTERKKAAKAKTKTKPKAEPVVTGEPLTAIIEELDELHGVTAKPVQSASSVGQAQTLQQAVLAPPAAPPEQPQSTPVPVPNQPVSRIRVRSIGSEHRVSPRYKTNVHVPPRHVARVGMIAPQQLRPGEGRSMDGLLTAYPEA